MHFPASFESRTDTRLSLDSAVRNSVVLGAASNQQKELLNLPRSTARITGVAISISESWLGSGRGKEENDFFSMAQRYPAILLAARR
jgi:hypothetical protein